jgi:methylamine dehydrogenase heavy chain
VSDTRTNYADLWRAAGRKLGLVAILTVFVVLRVTSASAELESERPSVAKVPSQSGAHWVWVNDMNFFGISDGKSMLLNADSGKMLGLLNTGYFAGKLMLPSHRKEVYAVETYFSRGSRGTRSDFLVVYDPTSLSPIAEIEIPAKKATGIPMPSYNGLTDDDRFALVYNNTPAQSVSVIDVKERRFAGEIETPGCGLVFPSGDRRFRMLCSNGGMLTVELDDRGGLKEKFRSDPFFDPDDPVTEKAVRWGDRWIFVSFDGYAYPVDAGGREPKFESRWSLFSDSEREATWKIGGVQHLAVNDATGTLFSLVHQGGADTHKDGGVDVWVYDLERKTQTRKITLKNFSTSIQVTPDSSPLLFGAMILGPILDVYDATTGQHQRAIEGAAVTPTILQAH